MRFLLLISLLLFLCYKVANAQTNAGIPDPSTVLVVYNANSDTSIMVKNYYVQARNIPAINVVHLQLPRREISVGDWSDPHIVKLGYNDEYIQDSTWAVWDSTHCVDTAKFHAWQYFLEEVVHPIRLHLQQNNLISTIRYVVMCRGVPYKIQATGDWSEPGNVSLDGLLCMLNSDNYEDFIKAIFNDYTTQCYPSCDPNAPPCTSNKIIPNPYFDQDPTFEMNARFLSDYYNGSWEGYDYKLSYLVSRLDGLSYDIITDIIEKSVNADKTGEKVWIIDGGGPGSSDMSRAFYKLNLLGFPTEYNSEINNWIVTSEDSVMGYTSAGVHQGMPPRYIQDILNFNYANGAVFNTYESYNGYSIGTLRPQGQGLMTEFLLKGGTGGAGHSWEPIGDGVISDEVYFPYYAIGYNQIDAAWQGMPYLAWRNVVVGDPLTRIYNCENNIISSNTTIGSGDYDCSIIVPQNVTLTVSSGSILNFRRNASLKVYGRLELENNTTINFNGYSKLYVNGTAALIMTNNMVFNDESKLIINGQLTIEGSEGLELNNNSSLDVLGSLLITAGSIINLNDESSIQVSGTMISQGTEADNVEINFESSQKQIEFSNGDSLIVNYTIVNNGGLAVRFTSTEVELKALKVTNSVFSNPYRGLSIYLYGNTPLSTAEISNCDINFVGPLNYSPIAIDLQEIPEMIIDYNTISFSSVIGLRGINLFNNGLITISRCTISGSSTGINSKISSDQESPPIKSLESNILISGCNVDHCSTGIVINNQNASYLSLQILDNDIVNCSTGISINQFNNFSPIISDNRIIDFTSYGISLTNGSSVTIRNDSVITSNSSAENPIGIYLSQVANPYILENYISTSLPDPGSGIVSVSSSGNYRLNEISGHFYGVELANSSSPNLAQNEIHNNKNYGVYISTGSNPKLDKGVAGGLTYPVSGYNNIYENGVGGALLSDPEIYINRANIQLSKGCNTIADDRYNPPNYNHTLLVDGINVQSSILADSNYWGDHPLYGHNPAQRFGSGVSLRYTPYDIVPCTYSAGGSGLLVLKTTTGSIVDTLLADGTLPGQLSQIESAYSDANYNFYSDNFNSAEIIYKQIIAGSEDSTYSLEAYSKLYLIKKYQNANARGYENLREYYSGKLSAVADSGILLALNNLIDMCTVSREQYEQAISSFDQTAQNNPGTDIALYNEINAFTTALLVDTTNGLSKSAGKYKSRDVTEYLKNVGDLLKTRGKKVEDYKDELIPTEYLLYQNYPNPFNPVTTIKYAIPKNVNVELKVFNILGQEVKTLVNETKNPGYYEVQFNAGNFASGVYLYRIIAGEFIKTGKMILIK